MNLTVADTPAAAARLAGAAVAAHLVDAIEARGHATLALSGGSSPRPLFTSLAGHDLPWHDVYVFQVDERQVPHASSDRNWRLIDERLIRPTGAMARPLSVAPGGDGRVRAMLRGSDAARLRAYAGEPIQLDVVHLGLGTDGHTASWPPGHPVMGSGEPLGEVADFNGTDRITLTPTIVNAARHVIWFIVNAAKAQMLARLMAGDQTIPAAQVSPIRSEVFTDIR